MTRLRRRILRPVHPNGSHLADERRQRAAAKRRQRLEHEQVAFVRWMTRLRRAFHAVERGQSRVARLQRKLAELEAS